MTQRQGQRRRKQSPALAADELDGKYIVRVPVLAEGAVAPETDVGIAGHRLAGNRDTLGTQTLCSDALHFDAIQYQCRAGIEVPVETDLVQSPALHAEARIVFGVGLASISP